MFDDPIKFKVNEKVAVQKPQKRSVRVKKPLKDIFGGTPCIYYILFYSILFCIFLFFVFLIALFIQTDSDKNISRTYKTYKILRLLTKFRFLIHFKIKKITFIKTVYIPNYQCLQNLACTFLRTILIAKGAQKRGGWVGGGGGGG